MRNSELFDRGLTAKCRKSGSSYVSVNDIGHAFDVLNPIRDGAECRDEWIGKNPDPAPVRGDPNYIDPLSLKYPLSPKAQAALYNIACDARHKIFLRDLQDAREAKNLGNFPSPREPGCFQKEARPASVIKDAVTLEIENIERLKEALASAQARLEKKHADLSS